MVLLRSIRSRRIFTISFCPTFLIGQAHKATYKEVCSALHTPSAISIGHSHSNRNDARSYLRRESCHTDEVSLDCPPSCFDSRQYSDPQWSSPPLLGWTGTPPPYPQQTALLSLASRQILITVWHYLPCHLCLMRERRQMVAGPQQRQCTCS